MEQTEITHKLNCEDVSIGDWVFFVKNDNGNVTLVPDKIMSLSWVHVDGEYEEGDWMSVEGMPITREILLMNGFAEKEGRFVCYCDYPLVITFPVLGFVTVRGVENLFLRCRFVHELQHILRMVHMDKKAKDWRVEQ